MSTDCLLTSLIWSIVVNAALLVLCILQAMVLTAVRQRERQGGENGQP